MAGSAEPSELIQLEMSEGIRLGSPDDGSNNLDSDFHMLAVTQPGSSVDHQRRADSYRAESARRWPMLPDPLSGGGALQQPPPPPQTGKVTLKACWFKILKTVFLRIIENKFSSSFFI